MKLLDRYILTRYLYNFFSSFVILMFIFIFQTIWLFIDDLAGKGLDPVIFGKFFFYIMPSLTEKVLPLTVLLSSILTFGAFAENYEFAAMKASGISLQRAMRPLIIFVIFLGGVTFYFANSVIPAAEQKIYNLRRNIAKVKPAAIITEGVFSDLEGTGMNMKVDKKYGEDDRFLETVVIHEKSKSNLNITVIKAETGELVSSEKSDLLKLVLRNGHYYSEVKSETSENKRTFPYTRSDFETYIINKDISDLNSVDLEEERNISTDKMKNVSRLIKDIDSLQEKTVDVINAFSKNITSRMGAFTIISKDTVKNPVKTTINTSQIDSLKEEKNTITNLNNDKSEDVVVATDSITANTIIDFFESRKQIQLVSSAKNTTSNILSTIKSKKQELDRWYKIHNMHILSLHSKFALALSCIILFFVGAPLGAIIRKGGIGLPLVIAVLLFLVYYFLGVFATNYAKEGNIHPILGAWLSSLIMLPLGIVLTKRATVDKGLISFGAIWDFIKGIFKQKGKELDLNTVTINTEIDTNTIQSLNREEIDVLKKSMTIISNFKSTKNLSNGVDFLQLHERNLADLRLLQKSDATGIIEKLMKEYPTISAQEIDFYLEKEKKALNFVALVMGKIAGLVFDLIKAKGHSLKTIKNKLERIANINNSLSSLLKNTF